MNCYDLLEYNRDLLKRLEEEGLISVKDYSELDNKIYTYRTAEFGNLIREAYFRDL